MEKKPRSRFLYASFVLIVIALGLASRAFPQFVPSLLDKYPGDCLWAMVAFLLVAILMPFQRTSRISFMALIGCFGVEMLKLVPSESLASARNTTIGHLLLGHTFMWQNLLAYAVGIVCAACLDVALIRSQAKIE